MFNDVSSTNFYASKDLYGAYFSPKNQLHAKNKLQTKEKNYFKYGVTSFDKAKSTMNTNLKAITTNVFGSLIAGISMHLNEQ